MGTPVYDEAKRRLTVPDLTWDVKTKNLLLKGARALLEENIRNELREAACFDLSAALDDAQSALRKSIDELEKLDDIHIQADVSEIKPSQPRIDADGIALTLTLTGHAKASFR